MERKIINEKKFKRVISPKTKAKAHKYAEAIRKNGRKARVIFEKTLFGKRYHVYEEVKK